MFKNLTLPTHLLTLSLTLAAILSFSCSDKPVQAQTLHGSATQHDYIRPESGPSLKREDITNMGDPFGSGNGEEAFDAPADSFNLKLNQNNNPMMGNPGQATPAMEAQKPINVVPPQQVAMKDPESVGQMKLAWDMWHKRVAEAIYVKYNALARVAFKRSRPLAARVAYNVTRNGQITNIRLVQRSPNLIFNTMIFGVLKSMNGNPILAYPPGSRRMSVEKAGTFLWNFNNGQGFKYTTGDTETFRRQK